MPRRHCEPESKIEKWLNEQVRKLGGKSYKFTSPGSPGVPDRIYLFPGGKIYFVELKRIIGKLSGAQVWQREQFQQMGVNVKVIYGMEQAKKFVEELKHEICTAQLSSVRNQ